MYELVDSYILYIPLKIIANRGEIIMNNKNKLLSELDLSTILPPFFTTADMEIDEIVVPLKVISPLINFEWYLYEYDKETRICWALVKGYFTECGTVSLDELESVSAEVDHTYTPKTVKELTGW